MTTTGAMPSSINDTSVGSNREVYRKRRSCEFTANELEHLENIERDALLQKLQVLGLFRGPTEQLRHWLYFFGNDPDNQAYGSELQQGLINLWSTFIVAETLLAAIATQPFITPQDLEGWKCTWYGMLWMLSLLADFAALATTAIFLGYSLANPGKLNWVWLCKIGALRGIPAVLVLSATFMSLVAIGFTAFIMYGWKVGTVCMVFEVITEAACNWCSSVLSNANSEVIKPE